MNVYAFSIKNRKRKFLQCLSICRVFAYLIGVNRYYYYQIKIKCTNYGINGLEWNFLLHSIGSVNNCCALNCCALNCCILPHFLYSLADKRTGKACFSNDHKKCSQFIALIATIHCSNCHTISIFVSQQGNDALQEE